MDKGFKRPHSTVVLDNLKPDKDRVKLLPPKIKGDNRKTLVLDLDETLVHSELKKVDDADIILTGFSNPPAIYVKVRPGVQEFLKRMSYSYELVIFTASVEEYATPLLEQLDKDNLIEHKLFRHHCRVIEEGTKGDWKNYVKDLSQLGRDLMDVIIVDNNPSAYLLHPQNAIPATSWYDDR